MKASSAVGVQNHHGIGPEQPERGAGLAWSFGAIAFWSTNALAGSTALKHLDIGVVLVLQFASATAALLIIQRATAGRSLPLSALTRRDRLHGAVVGVLGCTVGVLVNDRFSGRPSL